MESRIIHQTERQAERDHKSRNESTKKKHSGHNSGVNMALRKEEEILFKTQKDAKEKLNR